jgi:hypothetical protein
VTGPLLPVPAADHRTLCAHDLTGSHPRAGTRALVGTNPLAPEHDRVREPGARACATRAANLADAVPVSQATRTSARHIAAGVPERH